MEPGKDFWLFCHWSSAMQVHLGSTENIKKDIQVPYLLIISAKMRHCIVKGWMVCSQNFLNLFYRHFFFVFTVRQKIFPSCNSKTLCVMFTDSRQESLESKVRDEISFLLGGKKSIFNWFEWTLPPHATHCLASCLSSADAHWSA